MGYFAIHLNYLEEQSKDVLSKDLADRLTSLLEKDFYKKTGFAFGNGLEFFILAHCCPGKFFRNHMELGVKA